MRRLSLHIISLLREYNKVVLPGYGFFTLKYIAASFNANSNTFLPPSYTLSFQESPYSNDGLLLELYQKKSGESAIKAANLLHKDLSLISSSLEEHGVAVLPGLGIFRNQEGALIFTEEFYGNEIYHSIEFNPIIEASEIDDYLKDCVEKTEEIDEGSKKYVKAFNPDYFYIPIHKKLAKLAACFLLVAVVGLVSWFPVGRTGSPSATASITPIEISTNSPYKSQKEIKPETKKSTQVTSTQPVAIKNTVPMIQNEATTKEGEKETATPRYYAVVAAFKTEQEALKFVDTCKRGTCDLEIIRKSNYYMVTVASTVKKSDLELQMPAIHQDYPDAWLLALRK